MSGLFCKSISTLNCETSFPYALSFLCSGFSLGSDVPARLAYGNTCFEVIVKDKRRRECQCTHKSVPGKDPSIERLREVRYSYPLRIPTGLGSKKFSRMTSICVPSLIGY